MKKAYIFKKEKERKKKRTSRLENVVGVEMFVCSGIKLSSHGLSLSLFIMPKIGHHLSSAINSSITILTFEKPTKQQQCHSGY